METKTQTESWRDSAELMVTAVNACKQINPANPLNAAKAMPELLEAFQELVDIIQFELPISSNKKLFQIFKAHQKSLLAIKQATE